MYKIHWAESFKLTYWMDDKFCKQTILTTVDVA